MNNKVYDIRDITSVKDLFESSVELFGERTAFLSRNKDRITKVTYDKAGEDAKNFAAYLNSLGLSGKKIGVAGSNCYEWALTYLTVCSGVGIIMPTDKDLNGEQLRFVFEDSGASAVVFSDGMRGKVEGAVSDDCILIPFSEIPECVEKGRALREAGDRSYEEHRVDPKAFGILLYTSGTMGVAKGVMLSQYNVAVNVMQALRRTGVSPDDRALSVLPLHHTYECMAGFLSFIYAGASVAYNASLRTLMGDFKAFAPTVFVTVPLIMDTFYKNILKKYKSVKGGRALLSMQTAMAAKMKPAARKKIFSTVNEVFGGKLRAFLCGAAPLPKEIFEAFKTFGFDVFVGYGLTETAPVCMMHSDDYADPSDVGYPISGLRAKIVDADANGIGELAVKGPNVMIGYYNQPEETEKVLRDGWFYTGDLARRNENGTYSITGRIKSMIVAENGKKIFPEELESELSKYPLVAECLVFQTPGGRPGAVTASIYPDEEAMATVADRDAAIKEIVDEVNKKFPHYKHITDTVIRSEPFEKTTTRKIKRNAEENLRGNR